MPMTKKKRDVEHQSRCPECGGYIVTDYERGERHCEMCGIVIEDSMIDAGLDYRVFDEEDRVKEHVGPPSTHLLHDKGLPTDIDPRMKDSYGRHLTPTAKRDAQRLRHWQWRSRISNSTQRNLAKAFTQIGAICSRLELSSSLHEEVNFLYKRAVLNKFIRGRSIVSVISACVYTACRMHGVPRTLDEISLATGVGRKEIGRVYRQMRKEFDITLKPLTGFEFIERFCSHLEVSPITVTEVYRLMELCEKGLLISGKGPMGVTAACIYLACTKHELTPDGKPRYTQKDIADIVSVTEITIKNRCSEIEALQETDK